MRNAIFISAGIGNALLLVPLIKRLREQGSLTAISTSPFGAEAVFEGFEEALFDDVIQMATTVDWMKQVASFKHRFNTTYLDHFASGRKNILFASSHSKEVITNTLPRKLPSLFKGRLSVIKPELNLHEASQYLRYVQPDFHDGLLNEGLFSLTSKPVNAITQRPYITVQPSSGNNAAPWKTLPMEKWSAILHTLAQQYATYDFVIMGDESEQGLIDHLPKHTNIINLLGKTEMATLPGIIGGAAIHLGNDSGLMHIAGCLGVPTVTAWGGSDPTLYGWQKVNPKKHKIIYKSPTCGPCSRWISPNNTKIHNPARCPDFACIEAISSAELVAAVAKQLTE